jgi:hypothetical protein
MDADYEFENAIVGNQVPKGALIEYVQRKEPGVQIHNQEKPDEKPPRSEKVTDSSKERQHTFSVDFYCELSLKHFVAGLFF